MTENAAPEPCYAGAYWGPRRESHEDCARRTAHLLPLLAACDPFLAQWYKPTRSTRDRRAHPLMPPDEAVLSDLFRGGANRESGGPIIEELGYSFWFGNGGSGADSASLQIKCGDYAGANPNCCLMPLPRKGLNAERITTAPVLTSIVRSQVLAWEPDWAVATSDDYRKRMSPTSDAGTFVGWVTYFSRHRGTVPPLPAPVRIEPVENMGTLIILTPERVTTHDAGHVQLGRRVGELLARAGLLRPVVP
ncbi:MULTISPECIES: immunity 52 family protein [unclassified Myxococcus]|uniref:immunity 52 family protein n=1 Tax=unclassified Myxococcus TaxID=2648731 RepID=UPI001DB1BD0E|nr:immunity 52 family protein [Myxococcus sp. MISCRS1]MBZ4408686.1 immunity 52 family protein [Myxococcus sp. XM-1-1-1]